MPAPTPQHHQRTPIRDEVLAAIRAHVAGGASIHSLAKAAGLSRSIVDRYSDGSRDLTVASLERLARPLNLKLVQVAATTPARRRRRGSGAGEAS